MKTEVLILGEQTTLKEIQQAKFLKVYRSSSSPDDSIKRSQQHADKNMHVGSYIQALDRADYKINDQEEYTTGYLHEIIIRINKLYPTLIVDHGYNVNQSEEDQYKLNWDILVYKNTGEGNVHTQNLSLIILNRDLIVSSRLHSKWTGDKLTRYFAKKLYDKLF